MWDLGFDYASCVKTSEKMAWKLDEVMPAGTRLDFSRPFLPEALAQTDKVACLSSEQRLKLNQITGNAYLNLFAFVEEFILATLVQHAQAEMFGDHDSIRALCRSADEEIKHQRLFARYRQAFDRDFGHPCGVLESAVAVAGVVLGKHPMAVMIVTLHIELMTLQHYTECVKDNHGIDPFFQSLLRHHWMEESQHARIDTLELEKMAMSASPEIIKTAIDDYLGILGAFDGLLEQQAKLDVASLEAATGKKCTEAETAEIIASQRQAYRKTFLTYGMTNPTFHEVMGKLSKEGQKRVSDAVATYSV